MAFRVHFLLGNAPGGGHQDGKEYETDQVFVSDLPSTVTEEAIKELFGSIGIIKIDKRTGSPKIWIYRHPDGTPKGDATVTYDDPPSASAAIKWFNGKLCHNMVNFKFQIVRNVKCFMVFVLVGKDFLGQVIKVEFAEKRVPKGGFGRGGGRGAVVFQFLHCQWIKYYATLHSKMLCSSRQYLRRRLHQGCFFFCLLGVSW